MRKRVAGILLGLVLLLVLSLAGLELLRPSEPVYLGTTVTGWIRVLSMEQTPTLFNTNRPRYVPRVRDSRRGGAMDAFRKIGAPATPYLAQALRKQDSVF